MPAPVTISVLIDKRTGAYLIRCPEYRSKPELETTDQLQASGWVDRLLAEFPGAAVQTSEGWFSDAWNPLPQPNNEN